MAISKLYGNQNACIGDGSGLVMVYDKQDFSEVGDSGCLAGSILMLQGQT